MEQLTKRILAIVLIAVIGVGIGITVWVFVAPYSWGAKDVPGLENQNIPEDQIIRMGVISGLYDIQGDAELKGARLAAKHINLDGGIDVGGKTYYIGITAEDTDESNPNLDTTKGVAAAERIINYKRCQFLLGGFRTESLDVYLETILNAKVPFIGTGAATDSFCANVLLDYTRYKYFFRIMPINSTSLGGEIFKYLLTFAAMNGVNKFGLLYEDLDWTKPTVAALKAYIPVLGAGFGAQVVASVGYPTSVTQLNMDDYIDDIDANNTQILIPIISAQGGILMMNSYARKQPGFVISGIDVQSQLDTFWGDTNGDCLYETVLQAVYNISKTSKTVEFWNDYHEEYGFDPLYTGVGAYDAVYLYANAINATQSFSADAIITYLEGYNKANYYEGVSGILAFTPSHDQYEGYPYGYTLFVQWQPGDEPGTGKKVVVPSIISTPPNYIYPPSMWTGTYLLPEWPGWAFNT
jgi:branched-chain amino acid transport system substrate-binding protein